MNGWQSAVSVIRQCLDAGVRDFVVCAGARNAMLLEAIARAEAAGLARVWRHYEERSAGFFALGRTMCTAKPCAVVTTSGTAAAELLPAVIEAYYQSRPLVAITADRPAEFRGSGSPQSMDQIGLYGQHAVQCDLKDWDGRGPLHWNVECGESIECGDENFNGLVAGEFALWKDKLDVAALARWLREDLYLGLVVMIGGLEPEEREDVFHFCMELGVPVVADATSGLREALQGLHVHDADRVLKARPPSKVLRLGEVPAGRFWRDLEDMSQVSVWSVCRSGLPGLARASGVTRGPLQRVFAALGDVDPADDALDHLVGNSGRAARIDELLECYPDSEPGLIRALSYYAAIGSGVFLGNSLPVREWNAFAQWMHPVTQVRANRGVNGIDGQISTWLGFSAEHEQAWAVIGDLTALYDVAAGFMMGQIETKGRVLVVINNGGGGIFKRLPRLGTMSARTAECILNPHQADLSGMAAIWGWKHLRIRSVDDLDQFESADQMTMLEVVPDIGQTERFWSDWDRWMKV